MNGKAGRRDRKMSHVLTGILLAVGCFAMALLMTSCGKEEISLTIRDGNTETTVTATEGETVAKVLETAGITVDGDDLVTPDLDCQIQSDDTEITIERHLEVTIYNGDDALLVRRFGGTVQDALDDAGIVLGENDEISVDPGEPLTNGMEIEIDHWYDVILVVDGETSEFLTNAATVGDLLDEMELEVGPQDKVSPALDRTIGEGRRIVITHMNTEEITETEEVPFEITYQDSSDLYEGETSLVQSGVNGEKEVTYEVTYVDGEETGREVVSEKVTLEPVNEIVLRGTKKLETATYSSRTASESSAGSGSTDSSVSESAGGSETAVVYGSVGESSTSSPSESSGGSESSADSGSTDSSVSDSSENSPDVSSESIPEESLESMPEESSESVPEESYGEATDSIPVDSSESLPDESSDSSQDGGRTVVSQQAYYYDDGSGHGYYEITYSDGTIEYVDF